jgi:hypothetical protein
MLAAAALLVALPCIETPPPVGLLLINGTVPKRLFWAWLYKTLVDGCDCDCRGGFHSVTLLVCSRCPAMTTQRCNDDQTHSAPSSFEALAAPTPLLLVAKALQGSHHVAVSDCRASTLKNQVGSSGSLTQQQAVCLHCRCKNSEVEGQENRILGRSNHGCATKMGTWPISAPAAKREPEAPFSNALGERISVISVAHNFRDSLKMETSSANSILCPAFSPFHPTSFGNIGSKRYLVETTACSCVICRETRLACQNCAKLAVLLQQTAGSPHRSLGALLSRELGQVKRASQRESRRLVVGSQPLGGSRGCSFPAFTGDARR